MLGGFWDDLGHLEFLRSSNFTANVPKMANKIRLRSHNITPMFLKINDLLKGQGLTPEFNYEENPEQRSFHTESLHDCIRPDGKYIPMNRKSRKKIQVENMLHYCSRILELIISRRNNNADTGVCCQYKHGRIRVVEFCSGSGFVALPLAAIHPDIDFILIDQKSQSLQIAQKRVIEASLRNVSICLGDIRNSYQEPFDLGIALHACGTRYFQYYHFIHIIISFILFYIS